MKLNTTTITRVGLNLGHSIADTNVPDLPAKVNETPRTYASEVQSATAVSEENLAAMATAAMRTAWTTETKMFEDQEEEDANMMTEKKKNPVTSHFMSSVSFEVTYVRLWYLNRAKSRSRCL